MSFTEHDDVVEAFPANRANHPLGIRVLPRWARRNNRLPDVQLPRLTRKSFAIDLIAGSPCVEANVMMRFWEGRPAVATDLPSRLSASERPSPTLLERVGKQARESESCARVSAWRAAKNRRPSFGRFRLVLCPETPPLHITPEFLGHLSRANRCSTKHRFQAVRAPLKADRISSERSLLAPRPLWHRDSPS